VLLSVDLFILFRKGNIKNAIVLIRFNYYSKSKKAKKKKISFLLNPSATFFF
jgi:hypothetical protein